MEISEGSVSLWEDVTSHMDCRDVWQVSPCVMLDPDPLSLSVTRGLGVGSLIRAPHTQIWR